MKTLCNLTTYRTALLALVLLLNSCVGIEQAAGPAVAAGNALEIHSSTLLYGVNQALKGAHGYYIFANQAENQFLVMWNSCGNGYCMGLIDTAKSRLVDWESAGTWINGKDATNFVRSALEYGWKPINPAKDTTAILPLAQQADMAIKQRGWLYQLLQKSPRIAAQSVEQMQTASIVGASPGLTTFVLLVEGDFDNEILSEYAPTSVSDRGE